MDSAATPLERAELALQSRQDSPTRARELAIDALADADDPESRVVALWALGLAFRELNQLPEAERNLDAADTEAAAAELHERRRSVRSALVNVVTMRGRPAEALSIADELTGELAGIELADLEMKRALALLQLGRVDEAITAYSAALPAISAGDDRALEARLLSNRGNALAYQGRLREAIDDSLAAYRLADEAGQHFLAGCAIHNAGFVYGRNGDVVAALRSFDEAEARYAAEGFPGRSDGVLAADRGEVLLIAGLAGDARSSAEAAVRALEGVDDINDLAEARLLQARASLAAADPADAADAADAARRDFERAGRPGWAALAEVVSIRARSQLGDAAAVATAPTSERVATLATELEDSGWNAEASGAMLIAAEFALDADDHDLAEQHLERTASARQLRRPDTSAAAWLATARLRTLRGNTGGAHRAIAAGLRSVADHRSRVGATELKIGSSVHAAELAALSLRLTLAGGDPRRILRSAELIRSSALERSTDPERHEQIAYERRRLHEIEREVHRHPDDERLRASLAEQEQRLRQRARQVDGRASVTIDFDIDRVLAELCDTTLVEFVECDGALGAVSVARRRFRFHRLGEASEVVNSIDAAHFALSRLARDTTSQASRAAAALVLDAALDELDAQLVAPLGLDAERCVVVPTGALHGVPWSGLASLRERIVSVAANARSWRRLIAPDSDTLTVGLAAAPDVAFGTAEIEAIARHYSSVSDAVGADATVERVLALLDGADVAHIACHGAFRADSPMFSALRLVDGALNVFDIESLARPPRLVVLPVCNAAQADVRPGNELIGTASALRGIGVGTVIAPLTVINDRAAVEVMADLHRLIATGSAPVDALRRSRVAAIASGEPAAAAAAIALLSLE